jgi:hypothetical protein
MAVKSVARGVLALPAGFAAWVFAFWTPVVVASFVWLTLSEAGQQFQEEQRYDIFPTSTLVFFQFIWLLANCAAGFVAQWVGRSQRLVWIGGALLVAYFAYNHWWALWGVMPDWYNVLVVILVVPAVWFGSSLGRERT